MKKYLFIIIFFDLFSPILVNGSYKILHLFDITSSSVGPWAIYLTIINMTITPIFVVLLINSVKSVRNLTLNEKIPFFISGILVQIIIAFFTISIFIFGSWLFGITDYDLI